MTISYWVDTDLGEWDSLTLAGYTVPGVVEVEITEARDVDVKRTKGSDKATLEDNGSEPVEVEITVTLGTRRHWLDWQTILPQISPRKAGGISQPITATHPELTLAGVNALVIREIQSDAPSSKDGKRIRIRAIEWLPAPKPKPKAASKPKGGNVAKVRPIVNTNAMNWSPRFNNLEGLDAFDAATAGL